MRSCFTGDGVGVRDLCCDEDVVNISAGNSSSGPSFLGSKDTSMNPSSKIRKSFVSGFNSSPFSKLSIVHCMKKTTHA